ncbi:MAG: pseudouridine synthase [Candidatus Marinimicrobia bacterium]|nr:pseudouridine synthase [Candidatus Neomarinimicrobiota bacterium]
MMRLNRYLAASGIASRRKCESIIQSGRVTVNDQPVANPFSLVEKHDIVCLDGKAVVPAEEKVVIVLNKPEDTITSVEDNRNRRTVMDLIGNHNTRLFSVGRLDKDTTGVLLLTNDGDLAYSLTHPSFQVEKVYEAIIAGWLSSAEVHRIEKGVDIGEGETGVARVISQKACEGENDEPGLTVVRLTLTHGKKREIRRIFTALERHLKALRRVSFAGIGTGALDPGQWRFLRQKEISKLMSRAYND